MISRSPRRTPVLVSWLLVLGGCGASTAPEASQATATEAESSAGGASAARPPAPPPPSPGATMAAGDPQTVEVSDSGVAPSAVAASAVAASAVAAGAVAPDAAAPSEALPIASSPAFGSMAAQVAILERQGAELEQVVALIARVRPLAELGQDGLPPICADREPLEALRLAATSGSAGASVAQSTLESLERWCEPFDHWEHPPEAVNRSVLGYLQQLERIQGWMEDLRRCEQTTGAERARCENAYSDVQRETAAEAGRALALLRDHVRELAGVRSGAARFPCSTPVLARIDAQTWTGSVARPQMSGLSRAAQGVCDRIGVSDAQRREGVRRVMTALDRNESSARTQRRGLEEALAAMRPYLE